MAEFSSTIQPGEVVIDRPARIPAIVQGQYRGRRPRDFLVHPVGFSAYSQRFSLPLIPRSEWRDRCEYLERNGLLISQRLDAEKIKTKDQGRTNLCWAFAPVHLAGILRMLQGDPYIELSPASLACLITNYRNVGGWGTDAMEGLVELGVLPSSDWPDTAFDRSLDTSESRTKRERFKALEWWDWEPRDFDAQFSALLQDVPWAGGYNHASHEVACIDPLWIDGVPAIRYDNSWGTWNGNGRGIWKGERMAAADDACSPRSMVPSVN